MRVLSAMKIKNAAIRMKMAGNATLSRMVGFMVFFANVRDHRRSPVARLVLNER